MDYSCETCNANHLQQNKISLKRLSESTLQNEKILNINSKDLKRDTAIIIPEKYKLNEKRLSGFTYFTKTFSSG